MRMLRCRDVGFDCDGVVTAESDEAVLAQAAAHARSAHGVEITAEQAAHIRTLIRGAAGDPRRSALQPPSHSAPVD